MGAEEVWSLIRLHVICVCTYNNLKYLTVTWCSFHDIRIATKCFSLIEPEPNRNVTRIIDSIKLRYLVMREKSLVNVQSFGTWLIVGALYLPCIKKCCVNGCNFLLCPPTIFVIFTYLNSCMTIMRTIYHNSLVKFSYFVLFVNYISVNVQIMIYVYIL